MFKNYLTYQFVLSFHQLCITIPIEDRGQRIRLHRSAEQMIQSFALSLNAKTAREESPHYFSALLNLRDCREVLVAAEIYTGEIAIKLEILHDRFERLCDTVGETKGDQLDLLG